MKTASPALAAYLASRPAQIVAPDCFTFTLAGGQQYRYTNADVPVTIWPQGSVDEASGDLGLGLLGSMLLGASPTDSPLVFAANSVRISGLKYSIKIGVDVDEQDVTIACLTPPVYAAGAGTASGNLGTGNLGAMLLGAGSSPVPTFGPSTELIEGVPFLEALQAGLFDGAYLQRDRAFLPAWGSPAIGSVTLFHGRISTIDKIGRTEAQVKVKSDLVLLDVDFPRNLYQPSCLHTLYDSGCTGTGTVTKTNPLYQHAGTVGAGTTALAIAWSGATLDNFAQGTVTFTSGEADGLSATIGWSNGSFIGLIRPLPIVPAVGDNFLANWGCDHTRGAQGCTKFNNLTNWRGFDLVPPPSTAL